MAAVVVNSAACICDAIDGTGGCEDIGLFDSGVVAEAAAGTGAVGTEAAVDVVGAAAAAGGIGGGCALRTVVVLTRPPSARLACGGGAIRGR